MIDKLINRLIEKGLSDHQIIKRLTENSVNAHKLAQLEPFTEQDMDAIESLYDTYDEEVISLIEYYLMDGYVSNQRVDNTINQILMRHGTEASAVQLAFDDAASAIRAARHRA